MYKAVLQAKSLIRERSISAIDFSEMTGLSEPTYYKLMRRKNFCPSIETLQKIGSGFGLDLNIEFNSTKSPAER